MKKSNLQNKDSAVFLMWSYYDNIYVDTWDAHNYWSSVQLSTPVLKELEHGLSLNRFNT